MNRNNDKIQQQAIQVIRSWREDWNKAAREALGVSLDREQQEVLSSVQHNPLTSVASGTARGKDFVAAVAAFLFLYLTPAGTATGSSLRTQRSPSQLQPTGR